MPRFVRDVDGKKTCHLESRAPLGFIEFPRGDEGVTLYFLSDISKN